MLKEMFSPLTRFYNPELAKQEKEEKEREEALQKRRSDALTKLKADKDFQEFVIAYIEKRIEMLSDIDSMPDKGNLENEVFGRKQRLQELKDFRRVLQLQ